VNRKHCESIAIPRTRTLSAPTWRILLFLVPLAVMPEIGQSASIIWGTHAGAGARDPSGYISGIRVPGGPVDLSNGPLVQLIKAVGEVDDPHQHLAAYMDPSYVIDDVILDELHVGYGLGPPGAPAKGEWSRTTEVDIIPGDVIYARLYNMPKAEVGARDGWYTRVTIRNTEGMIVSHTVEVVDSPQTYLFDNLKTEPIPEPATLLFLVPGLGIWALRRKKHVLRDSR